MKILTASQIREADQVTINRQNITSFELMQRASGVCAEVICNRFAPDVPVIVICGTGNNGGDGLCIARILHRVGYAVVACVVPTTSKPSLDFQFAKQELEATPGALLQEGLPEQATGATILVIDALFGTGLNGPVTGPGLQAIQWINNSNATVVSIDLPSGMPADPVDNGNEFTVVQSAITLTFASPKLSMLLPGLGESAGEVVILDIGLDQEYISHIPDRYQLLSPELAKQFYRPRKRFSHKGTFGHALLAAGSKGKMGAALMAARACLSSGVGLLTMHIPGCGYIPAQTAIPEAMISTDRDENCITTFPELNNYTAIGIGPGIGNHPETTTALKQFLPPASRLLPPIILDADALNILSQNPELLKYLNKQFVLTPHPGEFRRLAGEWNGDAALLSLTEKFALKNRCILVLKGHRTIITNGEQTWFNTTGNAGMAKGGSGDVLTGIITGLAASGYPALQAALTGVYLHGKAGDEACAGKGQEAMTASDLIACLPSAWKTIS